MSNLNDSDILIWKDKGRLKESVCEFYGLDKIKDESFPKSFSHTSKKVIFSAGEGDNYSRYFLKEIPDYVRKSKNLNLNIFFQNYLKENLLPIPSIQHTITGSQYLDLQGSVFTLSEYIDGDYFNGSYKDIREAILALSDMHSHSKKLKNKNFEKIYPSDISIYFVDEFIKKLSLAGDYYKYEKLINNLKLKISKIEENIKKEPLAFIISHGDFNPFNIVFEKHSREVIAINDFDNVNYLLRIHDLAEAILTFSFICYQGASSSFANYIPNKIDIEKTKLILDTYLIDNNLNLKEKKFLPNITFIVFVELLFLGLVREDYSLDKLDCIDKFEKDIHNFFDQYFV